VLYHQICLLAVPHAASASSKLLSSSAQLSWETLSHEPIYLAFATWRLAPPINPRRGGHRAGSAVPRHAVRVVRHEIVAKLMDRSRSHGMRWLGEANSYSSLLGFVCMCTLLAL
jgi:hypothetical protein